MPGGSILITSAPKSDITVAAAGPAMKLAQSMTFSPSKMRSVTGQPLFELWFHHEDTKDTKERNFVPLRDLRVFVVNLDGEAVGVAVAHDTAGGGAGEMRADHQHRPLRQLLQHALARLPRLIRVAVGSGAPVRSRALAGGVHKRY